MTLNDSLLTLKEIAELPDNWNDNRASRFSDKLIELAKDIVNCLPVQPYIVPTARNSIQFEFETCNKEYLEFELFDDKMEFLYEKSDGQMETGAVSSNLLADSLVKGMKQVVCNHPLLSQEISNLRVLDDIPSQVQAVNMLIGHIDWVFCWFDKEKEKYKRHILANLRAALKLSCEGSVYSEEQIKLLERVTLRFQQETVGEKDVVIAFDDLEYANLSPFVVLEG